MKNMFRNVLLVDDCDITLRRLSKELRAEGYVVSTAVNGADALVAIQDSCPDFVITDWQMPNVDGQMLCQILRNGNYNQYIYLILMTAHSELLGLVEGLGSGADDYITKPVDIRELVARMASGSRILELDRRLNHAASTDPLTGVLNRRNMFATMKNIVSVCSAKKQSVSCIMLDIDHFKQINDRFGHPTGDQVLIRVADCLTERFRTADYVCRYGGEEFAVILPDCDEQGAESCAQRCRAEIEKMEFFCRGENFRVTVSFGCAQLTEGDTAAQMFDKADRALYYAKHHGRNQVRRFSQMKPFAGNSKTPHAMPVGSTIPMPGTRAAN
ncbi:MAG: diguanylate cyclase [Planctomycetota bacterium]